MDFAFQEAMPLQIGWTDIALRIVLTIAAGALIGLNREERGHPAGLRTTILVCLAASMSMIEVNLLLIVDGKGPSSFVVLDLMRLPLGILSGMGFIGAGAIIRKENLVTGVTTAATLWFVTMVGICLGGGKLIFGSTCAVIGFVALWALKQIEAHWHRDQRGVLIVTSETAQPPYDEIVNRIREGGGRIVKLTNTKLGDPPDHREFAWEIAWKACPGNPRPPRFLEMLSQNGSLLQVEWKL